MRLTKGMNVKCHDGNEYIIGNRTPDNYVAGLKETSGSQRLFKPDGKYAGGDKSKNIAREL